MTNQTPTPELLAGRLAKCENCLANTSPVQSNERLPYFTYRPEHEYDFYYCGCVGWD
jgi:hypothetical protein